MTRLSAIPALAGILLLAACSGAEAPETQPVDGLDSPDRTLAWSGEELYAIGGFSAAEWAEFGSIESLGFDAQGNLYLLDGQTGKITHVSPEGEFVRTISQQGQGPGELAQPMGMTVTPDRLIVSDIGHRGFSVFGTDGEWIENVPVDLARIGLPIGGLDVHPSGDLVGRSMIRMSFGEPDESEEDSPPPGQPIFRFAMDGESESRAIYYTWDPPEPEGPETEMSASSSDGNAIQFRMGQLEGFRPRASYAALPDGQIAIADTTDYRIRLVDGETGSQVGELRRPIPPTPVDDRIRGLERERQLEAANEGFGGRVITMGSGGAGSMSFDQGQMAEQMRQRVENMVFYPEIQVIEALAADPQGRIWVQRSSGVPGEDGPTDLLTPDGRYLGTLSADGLRIPDAFGPGGLVAVIETDEFDIPTVRVLRIPTEVPAG